MNLRGPGRPAREKGGSKTVNVRFTNSEMQTLDALAPLYESNRSLVIRAALSYAEAELAASQLQGWSFEQFRAVCKLPASEWQRPMRTGPSPLGTLSRVQLLATVECEDPADAARTDAVARVLDDPHALTGVIAVAPGTLLFTAFTGDDGPRGIMWARQEAMENLARLDGEDDRVWQLQLARQVVRPDFWRATPSTIDEHEQWRSWRATV